MSEQGLQNVFTRFIQSLKSSHLLMLLTGLFVADLVFPDPIWLVDEIFLGIVTLLVARWKMRRQVPFEAEKPPAKNVTPPPPPPAGTPTPADPPNTP